MSSTKEQRGDYAQLRCASARIKFLARSRNIRARARLRARAHSRSARDCAQELVLFTHQMRNLVMPTTACKVLVLPAVPAEVPEIVPGDKAKFFAKQIVDSIDVLTPQQLGGR